MSPGSPGAPPLPRLLVLVLGARFVEGGPLSEFVGPALVIAGGSLLLGLGCGLHRPARILAGLSLLLALALTGGRGDARMPVVFDGQVLTSGAMTPDSLLEPAAAAPGDRMHVLRQFAPARPERPERPEQSARSARGPVPCNRVPRSSGQELRPDEVVRVERAASGWVRFASSVRGLLAQLRRSWMHRVDRLDDEVTRELTRSLVFGESRSLPVEVADLFTRTGTRHLLAVSGLHVALLLLIVIAPVSNLLVRVFLGRGSRRIQLVARDALCALALVALVFLAGAHAPILRAASAYTFARLATHLPRRQRDPRGQQLLVSRRADSLSVLSLALIAECFTAGSEPLSLSVRLSYGATFGLILGTGTITRFLRDRLGLADRLPVRTDGEGLASLGVWVRVPARHLVDLLVAGLAASVAASCMTLPIVWWEFGEWSPVGMLATPLVLPLFTLVLALAWLSIPLPVELVESSLNMAVEWLLAALRLADRLPGTPALLPARPAWWLAGLLALVAASLLATNRTRGGGRLAWLTNRGLALWLGAGLVPWTLAARTPELHLLDVGHGTAVCLRLPGEPVWIFDAGSRDRRGVAREALLPLLASWETAKLRVLVSHADRDHCSALDRIATRIPIDVWAGAPPEECRLAETNVGTRLDLEAGELLLPTRRNADHSLLLWRHGPSPGNEGSRSLLLRVGNWRAALCADAEGEAASALARHLEQGPGVDLLLLPHHGSDGPFFGRLLDAARPREVWISSSQTPPTVGELDRRGLSWRSTALEGPLQERPPLARVQAGNEPRTVKCE